MRKAILAVWSFALVWTAHGQAPQAPAPPQAPPARSAYALAFSASLADGRPLVIGVGCQPPSGDWHRCDTPFLTGYPGPCIVVALPRGGDLFWKATLPAGATDVTVRAALSPAPTIAPISYPVSPSWSAPAAMPFSGGGGGRC